MPTVFIAGATGYLGRFLVQTYVDAGWDVRALVRSRSSKAAKTLPVEATRVEAQATRPETLSGVMANADLVISSLGITRQRDGLSYVDVDYRANRNLLSESLRAGVTRFAYIHVLGAAQMAHVPLVAAKQAFVDELQAAHIASTVVCPSGYFSDMGDFLSMAKRGRVWLFGDGQNRINPIHGADLAQAVFETIEAGTPWAEVGGPEVFTHEQLARLAFQSLKKTPKITKLPDWMRKAALKIIPHATPAHIAGPSAFFLSAMGLDMAATCHGHRSLSAYFADTNAEQ